MTTNPFSTVKIYISRAKSYPLMVTGLKIAAGIGALSLALWAGYFWTFRWLLLVPAVITLIAAAWLALSAYYAYRSSVIKPWVILSPSGISIRYWSPIPWATPQRFISWHDVEDLVMYALPLKTGTQNTRAIGIKIRGEQPSARYMIIEGMGQRERDTRPLSLEEIQQEIAQRWRASQNKYNKHSFMR